MRSSSDKEEVLSCCSRLQQNWRQSFMIESRILESEPMSRKDCEINAIKYLIKQTN